MSLERKVAFWIAALAVLVAWLSLLSEMLLPFVAGTGIAEIRALPSDLQCMESPLHVGQNTDREAG
jgi:hypothetical protein